VFQYGAIGFNAYAEDYLEEMRRRSLYGNGSFSFLLGFSSHGIAVWNVKSTNPSDDGF
jgi:hypothetical protein